MFDGIQPKGWLLTSKSILTMSLGRANTCLTASSSSCTASGSASGDAPRSISLRDIFSTKRYPWSQFPTIDAYSRYIYHSLICIYIQYIYIFLEVKKMGKERKVPKRAATEVLKKVSKIVSNFVLNNETISEKCLRCLKQCLKITPFSELLGTVLEWKKVLGGFAAPAWLVVCARAQT